MGDLISVIVPIYNVETFLSRCISSIIGQTYHNIEILLIDDGSTDNSGKIAEQFACEDDRIAVYHKANGGLSDARNFGIEHAHGNCLTFIDSDDYVSVDYIDSLLNTMEHTDADIVIGGMEFVCDINPVVDTVCQENNFAVFSKDEALIKLLRLDMRQSACGKLYRKKLFDEIRFPVGKLYEDLAIAFDVIMLSDKVAMIDVPIYKYCIRVGSIMQSEFSMRQLDEVQIVEETMSRVLESYPEYEIYVKTRLVYSYFVVLQRILLSNESDLKSYKKELEAKIQSNSKGLLLRKEVKATTKAKIILYRFGEKPYMFFQKMADAVKTIKQTPSVFNK